MLRIAFSGHRNRIAQTESLDEIHALYPDALWVHGGAVGFDTQVEAYAKNHGIQTEIIRPDYQRFGRSAPLKRNHLILQGAALLVACYDGRKSGGTVYTLNLAKSLKIQITLTGIQK